MSVVLLLLLFVFAYPFVVYPALLRVIARGRKPAAAREPATPYPGVTLLICALNEGGIIRQKLENSLSLRYPGPFRVVVVSDGSTDATAAIVREHAPKGVELIERVERRGKVANVNAVVPELASDIVVFSDANVMFDRDAILWLVARLQEEGAGCVSGKVVLVGSADDLRQSEENYYSIEWGLQRDASLLYSMVGADGAMHALWRKLFRGCPNDTIIEDLVIPIDVVRQGYRVVFEPQAVAWETGVSGVAEEFRRKTRIAAGAAQGLLRGNAWPRSAPVSFWFVFLSHKLLRWLSPVVGLIALLLAALHPKLAVSEAVLAGFTLLSLVAALRYITRWSNPVLDSCFYFVFGQLSVLVGLVKGAAGKQSVLWAKRDR
jgi:poly-beta-1,6-N-acetyl-D-glucosamine synthase